MHASAVFICLWPLYHWFIQNVGLVSQAGPFPFHSANCFQYSYPICDWHCETERIWLVCLSDKYKSHKLARYQSLNTVWIGPEGTEWTMHSKNMWRQNQKSFSSVAVQVLCEFIHEIQALRLLGICINKKDHPSCWDKWMDNAAIWKAWAKPSQWNHELARKYLLYEC